MPPGAGDRAGPYEIVEAVGSGAMGRVFRARDTRLRRDVALKFLLDIGGPDATARVMREARAASALNHPNICHIYDVGESEHGPWIAMEFVEGASLDQRIPPGGLPIETAVTLGLQIAGAMAHAHARGIVHRDLKAGNCVWNADGLVKILDFGLASRAPDDVAATVTRSEGRSEAVVSGTPAYMAPEVLQGQRGDARSDLWALGVVLYELAAGVRPFSGGSVYELASAILTADPAPLPAHVPEAYRRVVARLLRKHPAERYQTAQEVRAALETLPPASERSALPPEEPTPALAPAARGWRAASLAVALLAAVAAAGTLLWSARDHSLTLSNVALLSASAVSHHAPSLSPDGSTVAFAAADAEGVPQIWIKRLAEGEPRQITFGATPASRPRWHPAGEGIVYARQNDGIWIVPALGGTSRRLVQHGMNPSLSRDGAWLAWETTEGIWVARSDGTDARAVDGVPPRYYSVPRSPALSPDGSQVAFFHAEAGPNGDFWIIPAGGGEPRRVTSDFREGGSPVWTADGTRLIFSSARTGSRTLWQLAVDGGEPEPLTTGAGEDDMPDLSADGTRLVFTNTRNSWDIRIADASGNERALQHGRNELLFPIFSPDGSRITYFGRHGPAVAIFTMARDGSDVRQLTSGVELNHQPRWSGDGLFIYFYQVRPDLGLRRVPVLGGPSVEVFPWNWEIENNASFAPDDERLVYTRLRRRGTTDQPVTIVRTVSTDAEVQLAEALYRPRFSRDGRFIAGVRADGTIGVCDAAGAGCRTLSHDVYKVAWGPGDERFYFMRGRSREGPQELWTIGTDGTDERKLLDVGRFRAIDRHFDVSPSGEIVWAPWEPGTSELWTAVVR